MELSREASGTAYLHGGRASFFFFFLVQLFIAVVRLLRVLKMGMKTDAAKVINNFVFSLHYFFVDSPSECEEPTELFIKLKSLHKVFRSGS